jgi:penicillin-binding protein 1A
MKVILMSESFQDGRMSRKNRKNSRKSKRAPRSIWKRILAIVGLFGAAIAVTILVYLISIIGTLDDFNPEDLQNYAQTSLVYDCQDNLISDIHGIENRIYVPLSEIPKHVQEAFIAVEDVRFRQHPALMSGECSVH